MADAKAKIIEAFRHIGHLNNKALIQMMKSVTSFLQSLCCEFMDVKDLPLDWGKKV